MYFFSGSKDRIFSYIFLNVSVYLFKSSPAVCLTSVGRTRKLLLPTGF